MRHAMSVASLVAVMGNSIILLLFSDKEKFSVAEYSFFPVEASVSKSFTLPVTVAVSRLVMLTDSIVLSPAHKKRGVLASMVKGFSTTMIVSANAWSRSCVWARAMKFHDVMLCGSLNSIIGIPQESVFIEEATNAVSLKSVRIAVVSKGSFSLSSATKPVAMLSSSVSERVLSKAAVADAKARFVFLFACFTAN